ncbi:anaerobic ribonucleoside-triphosphate reductase [Mediterraneibacter gnavus]|uniref:anaerobic ribonucleoside-triphosphate reductase n=1 Tax=Mediterraneibacter gnavus TaxID=33038 RepID=UPI0019223FD8|nr:anaerobic ribonucleoside-triphosphate reductase [Mediterraneibacter gnavus]
MKVIKKDGTLEKYNEQKIINAINKSAQRENFTFSQDEYGMICNRVINEIDEEDFENDEVPVGFIHNIVEKTLLDLFPKIGYQYQQYRNYKLDFVHMMDTVYEESQKIMYIGDKENSNTDSALVSTKRSLVLNELNKQLYKKFFLTVEERQAVNDGYIYIHDMSARRDTMNCCLFDVAEVMRGGFEMGNVWYNEPKTLDTAFDVIGDITLSAASQQYGGFTLPQIDEVLVPYAKKSYEKYKHEFYDIADNLLDYRHSDFEQKANDYAMKKVERDMEQGYQGLEYKFNTVSSSRGDYPFITITFGLGTDPFAKMASKTFLRVHREGQGKDGNKKPVLFPKLVFLYTEDLHGKGKVNEDLFEEGIKTSAKTMYPDWLSLDGDTTVSKMYHKYEKVISPMGCRAFLSPWYERGGMKPADEKDTPVFVGRFNIGAVSLHLPMILSKSRQENKDFYEVLDYYLEMIRKLHQRTYDYLGEMKASTNPLGYCEGGFLGGHLNPSDKIKPLLKPMTASFGITALNELQQLYNGKSLVEDGEFALETLKYIDAKVKEFKKEDGWLYAIYGTPAENLCGLQVKQFRKKYGIIPGVSDREYVSNSFHCGVWEDITPIQKQDLEHRFWNYIEGGRIQYCKYPIGYNHDAIKTLVRRAMSMGFYEGVNLSLAYCNNCGHEELNMDICPNCGSSDLTKIERMNGYLSYSRVHGDTRLNDAKMAEIADRKSM